MSMEKPKIYSRREYLELQIANKKNENVGAQVEYEVAMRMSISGKHVQKLQDAAVMFKNKIKANEGLIRIYEDYLAKEP